MADPPCLQGRRYIRVMRQLPIFRVGQGQQCVGVPVWNVSRGHNPLVYEAYMTKIRHTKCWRTPRLGIKELLCFQIYFLQMILEIHQHVSAS